jgi:hypothetical protein
MVRVKNLISLKNVIMKKLFFTTLAGLGVALLIGGSTGAKVKHHPKQVTAMSILDTVPDSPKKIQLVSYLLDTVPDSPKKIQQYANYKLDTVPDSPKKIQQYANYKLDTVPDSPKKIQLVYYKLDTVPDSPKKVMNLVAMR